MRGEGGLADVFNVHADRDQSLIDRVASEMFFSSTFRLLRSFAHVKANSDPEVGSRMALQSPDVSLVFQCSMTVLVG